jgi:hypothetical protein
LRNALSHPVIRPRPGIQTGVECEMLQTSPSEDSVELVRDTTAALFVINLCASTTPVALAHPASPELKRYTFFVTRRREEGRERFRLHMGYFQNLGDAEAMLAAVRDVYPAAWAGPAPESRTAAPRASARPTVVPVPSRAPVELELVAVAAPAAPMVAPAISLPTPTPTPTPEPSSAEVARPFELETMSNVREVLAQLADAPMPAPAMQQSKPAAPKAVKTQLAAPQPPAPAPVTRDPQKPALTPVQTLRVLETQPPLLPDVASASTANNIKVLTPEDTQTLRDIRLEAQRNASVSYAVQLVWAVQPIAMDALPHLAIFDAYTLYHVEGNRQGRRWYGLRLGFFSDAGAAKQVAHYVRSEYASVAVVPVTGKERDGARAPTLSAISVPQSAPQPRPDAAKIPTIRPLEKTAARADGLAGFELLPDAKPPPAKRDLDDAAATTQARAPKASKPSGKRVVVRPKNSKPSPPGAPQPLESTLEILGASTLTLDQSREIINDSAIRNTRRPKQDKGGRFSRLLSRLSEKRS